MQTDIHHSALHPNFCDIIKQHTTISNTGKDIFFLMTVVMLYACTYGIYIGILNALFLFYFLIIIKTIFSNLQIHKQCPKLQFDF